MLITENEVQFEPIKALSWKQPYATMMLYGKHETRSWYTNYRGLVLICSSKTPYNDLQLAAISGGLHTRRMKDMLATGKQPVLNGYAFAIGRLAHCYSMCEAITDTDKGVIEAKTYVKYYSDLWVHLYEDIRNIKPFYWHGTQGLRDITPEDRKRIILL